METISNQRATDILEKLVVAPFDQDIPESDKASTIWTSVSFRLEETLGTEIFDKWFADIIPLGITKNHLVLQTKSPFESTWIENNYQDLIDNLLEVFERNMNVLYVHPNMSH